MPNEIVICLHLAAFGCDQCKAIVQQEIDKERERCAKIAEEMDPHMSNRRKYRQIAQAIRGTTDR